VFKALARFAVKYRWVIIIFWVIAVPVVIKTLPSLSNVTNANNSAFLPSNSPSEQAFKLTVPFEGKHTAGTATLVAFSNQGAINLADQQAITRLENKISKLNNISVVKEQAISSDGQVEEILIGTSTSGFSNSATTTVTKIRSLFDQVSAPDNLDFHLTGTIAESVDTNNANNSSRNNTQLFILLFIIILLFIVYRSLLAPLITLIPAGISLLIASPIIAESTKAGVQVSPVTQLLLIVLLLGAGTDYGIFLVFRVRESLRGGLDAKEAVIEAMSHVGKVITFSALTVSTALLSLLLASFGFYKGLGPALAIGMVVLLLAGLTLLPALLTVFGRAAFWPMRHKVASDPLSTTWGRIANRVIARPLTTLIVGLVLLISLSFGLIGYRTGGFNNSGPPANSDSAIGSKIITAHFAAANSNPEELLFKFNSSVWNRLQVVSQIQKLLISSGVFKSIAGPIKIDGSNFNINDLQALYAKLGPPGLLPESTSLTSNPATAKEYQAYRSVSQFISSNGNTLQFYGILKAGPVGSTQASEAIPLVRATISRIANDVHASRSGVYSEDALVYDISNISSSDLHKVVPVVLIVIGILLAILLGSLVAPWYLIITVGLSYLATLGFANIVFVHLSSNSSGLSFFLPFLLFIFSMALGEDYNILVMSRIREEAHGDVSLRQAITKSIGITGTTVTSAGLILAGTFGVLGLVGGQSEVQQIGYSIAFGILLDTFFVRTLLVPSIAVLLGDYNWWPSKLYKQAVNRSKSAK